MARRPLVLPSLQLHDEGTVLRVVSLGKGRLGPREVVAAYAWIAGWLADQPPPAKDEDHPGISPGGDSRLMKGGAARPTVPPTRRRGR